LCALTDSAQRGFGQIEFHRADGPVILEHFRENIRHLLKGQAKAMVVTGSRQEAVRYPLAVKEYVKEMGYADVFPLVAFSGSVPPDEVIPEEVTDPLADMSILTYNRIVSPNDKPLVWLHGEVRSPPLSAKARLEVGFLLRQLQAGTLLSLPHSRPMPSIAPRCHELRVTDKNIIWRLIYRLDEDAVVILDVFAKKTMQTPKHVFEACQTRIKDYEAE
jgi:phage-related protein